ncbi:MAG: HEAT repeat domain-containing protein [Tepidisphaeraceae bacterium]
MIDDLLRTLVHSDNSAADDVLVDALRMGTVTEQRVILAAILARKTTGALIGVVEHYDKLAEALQVEILQNIKDFYTAIREAGRSSVAQQRLSAIKLIAQGRQGKLCYVLSENLHSGDERFGKAAAGALAALSRWICRGVRQLQWGETDSDGGPLVATAEPTNQPDVGLTPARLALHKELIENRAEIESALVRALELHRGSRQQELLHAALMLCDSADSVCIKILTTAKHGGQTPMLRKIQQVPEPEHVPAFLLGATHGGLRATFGVTFSKIDSPVVLEHVLRRTHWLKSNTLQLCVRQINAGVWWNDVELPAELARRTPAQIARIGDWIAHSSWTEPAVDAKFETLYTACGDNFAARLRLVRLVLARPGGSSIAFLAKVLSDSDERIIRIAARELIRRRPKEFEGTLLTLMSDAPESVRRVVGRAIGQSSFDSFWSRFDLMDPTRRRAAGKALMKLLPDGPHRIARLLTSGTIDQRVKAMQVALELDLVLALRAQILPLCGHPSPKVRSKAVTLLGELGVPAADALIEKAVVDPDARVRANAIEAMEARGNGTKFVQVLSERAAPAPTANAPTPSRPCTKCVWAWPARTCCRCSRTTGPSIA